jgi:hypothetical protein
MSKFRWISGLAVLILIAGGFTAAVTLHDPPDAPVHVTRECAFIATLESERLTAENRWFSANAGPAPFEIWRAEGLTGGAPRRLDLDRQNTRKQPWRSWLVRRLAPKTAKPVNCAPQLDAAKVPQRLKFNTGPSQSIERMQYSRVTFLPGDHYAMAAIRRCWLDPHGWDENVSVLIWKKGEAGWRPVSGHVKTMLYELPRFQPPMRCFEKPLQ